MPNANFLTQEPVCALDPLLFIPRIEYADSIFSWVMAQPGPYSLVILDMRNFHTINDIFGYEVGDAILSQFVSAIRARLPEHSKTMRFRHGDEFLFFVPLIEADTRNLFQELHEFSLGIKYSELAGENSFPISFRYATMPLDENKDHIEFLRAAEHRLRTVKGQGTPREPSKNLQP